MITKFISSATGIVTLDVYLRSQLYSNDPLFLFVSSGLAINVLMLMLAGLALAVSFRKSFKNWYAFAGCTALAIILCVIGLIGVFFSNLDYSFSNILLPLNYMLLMQSGIVLGICALSYRHAPVPAALKAFRPAMVINKFALLVPKIPHSPSPANGRSVRHA